MHVVHLNHITLVTNSTAPTFGALPSHKPHRGHKVDFLLWPGVSTQPLHGTVFNEATVYVVVRGWTQALAARLVERVALAFFVRAESVAVRLAEQGTTPVVFEDGMGGDVLRVTFPLWPGALMFAMGGLDLGEAHNVRAHASGEPGRGLDAYTCAFRGRVHDIERIMYAQKAGLDRAVDRGGVAL